MVFYPGNDIFILHANLAQLVEHFIRNEEVVGSTPIVGSSDLFLSRRDRFFSSADFWRHNFYTGSKRSN